MKAWRPAWPRPQKSSKRSTIIYEGLARRRHMTTTATASRRVLLLHGDRKEASRLIVLLTKAGFAVEVSSEPNPTLADFFDYPPSMVLVAEGTGGRSVETLARDLRADPLLGRLPIVFLIRD